MEGVPNKNHKQTWLIKDLEFATVVHDYEDVRTM